MQKSSKIVLALVFVLIALWAGYRLLFPPPLTDEQQITKQLDSAIAAAQSKDVSGIMAPVSQQFVDNNGYNSDQLRLMLARNIHDYSSISVLPSNLTVSVNGDTAHTDEYVTVSGAGTDEGVGFSRHGDLALDWKKEPDTRLLVIPTTTWRIVKADDGGILGGE